ncbi:MAG: chromate transporter [Deltaproteobacteria bacterium]|nr:chromate transporter [Deltaproteobacteria bacterium]
MARGDLVALFLHSLALWCISVGGPSTILPEFHRYLVQANQLLTNVQFVELYTLAQAAPGPNFMYATLMGWQLAGWTGATLMTLAVLLPTMTFALMLGRMNQSHPNATIVNVIKRGLTPITIGLMLASSTILIRAVSHNWRSYLLALLTIAAVLRTSWNPLWLLAVGALAGMLGVV